MTVSLAESLILEGEFARAAELLDAVLVQDSGNAPALHLRGVASIAVSDVSGIDLLRSAVALSPQPGWLRDLGSACLAAGLPDEALEAIQKALTAEPGNLEARFVLGRVLTAGGRADEAIETLQSLASNGRVLRALGEALFFAGRREVALERFLEAIALDPESESGRDWCAIVALSLSRFDLAVAQRRILADAAPGDCSAQCALATALWCAGEMDECLAISGRTIRQFPDEQAHVNWLRAVDHTTFDAAKSRAAWEAWSTWSRRGRVRLRTPAVRFRDPERALRVGYLLDEVHKRPNSYFIAPLLKSHSTQGFEVYCYRCSPEAAEEWNELNDLGYCVRDARGKGPEEVARMVHADRIDILVNVSWEFRNRHVAVFGHRAAPIQVELPHYPATTGHPDTDFIFTDNWICPPGHEAMYVERVRRLKNGYMGWDPPSVAPEVTALPAASNGFCTFGVFQKPSKLNASVWFAICEILRRLPDARLIVHQNSAEIERRDSATRQSFEKELSTREVDPRRVSFVGAREHAEHFEAIARCDVALDTFPYNGTSTTGDCLWMGVPVVTLNCEPHAGRVGYSILSRLGLEELVGQTRLEYIEKAVLLGGDVPRLVRIREGLRQRMRESVLTDARAIMSGIEREFREIWRERCVGSATKMRNRRQGR